ncbi:MAG: hypothetical protein ACI9IP_001390 [Arcticibacterium sp.]|jgi:hypothetical protein
MCSRSYLWTGIVMMFKKKNRDFYEKVKGMRKLILMMGLGLVGVSCTKTLWIDKEPNINTAMFRTYSWNTNKEVKANFYYNQAEIEEQIRREVNKSLEKLGYTYKKGEPVDFFVSYNLFIEEGFLENTVCPSGFYGNLGYSPDLSHSPKCEMPERTFVYDAGSLVVDLMDTRTGQIVWRGTTRNLIDNPRFAPEIITRRIGKLLGKLEGPI